MRRTLIALSALSACSGVDRAEHYGFVARLGQDTVSVEDVTRRGNTIVSEEVDRFPRVRQRHTVITLGADGGIRKLTMDIKTPSDSEARRSQHVDATVNADSVIMIKRDQHTALRWAFATGGATVVAHVPQMYSLYELYFTAAMKHLANAPRSANDTVGLRQFYIDREFDRFPLHHATVRRIAGNKAQIWHDWLSGIGEATLDSSGQHMLAYSGAGTTYKVDVARVDTPPNVQDIGTRFAAREQQSGVKQLSVRDTARATIGRASLTVDYSRPLMRGRALLGTLIPYGSVWRTGANAATQLTTTGPITLAGLTLPPATYTLWTLPTATGTQLIVNRQFGQWGTEYNPSRDLGRAMMRTDTLSTPVEQFTIEIVPGDAAHANLTMAWGMFRWTAPIVVTR